MKHQKINRLLLSLSKTGVWVYNLDRDYLDWDEVMFDIYGIDSDRFDHNFKSFRGLVHPDDIERVEQSFQKAVDTQGEFKEVFRVLTPKEELKYVKANGVEYLRNEAGERIFTGSNQDITQILKKEQQREELAEILAESQETAMIGSWQHDLKTGKTFNDIITKRIIGLPPDYDLQAHEGISYYKEGYSRDTIKRVFQELLETGKPYDVELEMYTADGRLKWVRALGKPKYDGEGNIIKVGGVFQDITAQKEKELALVESNTKLKALTDRLTEQNQKLSDFAHIASHNLRAPVANLMLLKDLLKSESNSEELVRLHEMIGESTEQLNDTLENLVEALIIQSKVDLSHENLNLEEILNQQLKKLGHLLKEAEVKVESELELRTLFFPPVYLESILLNLLSNALKFRRDGVESQIKVRSYLHPNQKKAIIEIIDNGLGIDLERHRERIFGLNNTFHRHASAKGVGLFMVKTHMESMGGEIELESEVGKGSCFRLIFPKNCIPKNATI